MSNLRLSDEKAKELIKVLKNIMHSCHIDFMSNPKGLIKLQSVDKRELSIYYNFSVNIIGKYTIHLMDQVTKHTLLRLNVCNDNTFHKNADGERIHGTRLNVFSEREFYEKGDGTTHYKAFYLPYEELEVHDDFSSTIDSFLEYTNTLEKNKIKIEEAVQLNLF